MLEILGLVNQWVVNTIESWGAYGALFSCILIIVESMVPILPLTVFIAINFLYYGPILGFIISWIFTCIGCSISFFLCQTTLQKFVNNKIRKIELAEKLFIRIEKISFPSLVSLIAMPFTPAFAINIVAGISNMSYKKFISAILIGKIFLVLFWGFVGVGLVESLKSPIYLLVIVGMLAIAYILSKLLNKKLKID